jgi:hypothetical protein
VVDNYGEDPIFSGLDKLPMSLWHASILGKASASNSDLTMLVDNSKRVNWCAQLRRNGRLDVRAVHLIRDPRALVSYWFKTYTTPRKIRQQRIRHARMAPLSAAHLLTCSELDLYIGKWLVRNRAITRMLKKMDSTENVVSYHDLANQTETQLQRLMPMLKLSYEQSQLDYGRAKQHGTMKREYEGATQASKITFDIRWSQDLAEHQIAYISNHPAVQAYLDSLGLQLCRRGITTQTTADGAIG